MAAKAAQAGRSPPLRRALRQSESAPVPDERKQMPLARACSDPVHPSPQAFFMLPHRGCYLFKLYMLAFILPCTDVVFLMLLLLQMFRWPGVRPLPASSRDASESKGTDGWPWLYLANWG